METWFLLYYYVLVIHQTTQNLNYGPDLQSQGHQSMYIGTALFTQWFPVWCFTIWLCVSQDLVILSPSVSRLSELMQVCGLYGLNHDIKYNSKKSAVLIFKSN